MDHTPDLRLYGPLLVDGEQVVCPACDTGSSLYLDRTGHRETWPARLGCTTCGHAEDHPVITNGLVDAALNACTGRESAEDGDAFEAEWRGITIVGERFPEFVMDDAVTVAEELAKAAQKGIKRDSRRWWRRTKRSARDRVGRGVGGVKAATLSAAWEAQTGGAGPVRQPSRRCRVRGCRSGWITVTSRVHSGTGRAEEVRVPCAACHRAA
jgi:hypothetical protein